MFDANFMALSSSTMMPTSTLNACYFKPFQSPVGDMAALFTADHGWIENVPAEALFIDGIPDGCNFEELYLIAEVPLEKFHQDFIDTRPDLGVKPPTAPAQVTIGSIIDSTAIAMDVSPKLMRDFTRAIFRQMRTKLSDGHSLDSSFVSVSAKEAEPLGWIFQFK